MAAKKYVSLVAGRLKEVVATITSTGAPNDGDLIALDATGKIDTSVLPAGVGPNTSTIQASEALSAGEIVNVHDSSGARVRKADATSEGKEAMGFVLAAVSSGANATVYGPGEIITGLTGLTIGAYYWLDTTAGAVVSTAPSTATNVSQRVGWAISATELMFDPDEPVTVA